MIPFLGRGFLPEDVVETLLHTPTVFVCEHMGLSQSGPHVPPLPFSAALRSEPSVCRGKPCDEPPRRTLLFDARSESTFRPSTRDAAQ